MTACACKKCVGCCWNNPGWFGSKKEIINSAKALHVSLKKFFEEYLINKFWVGEFEYVMIPAPRRDFSRHKRGLRRTIIEDRCWGEEAKKNGKGFVRASWGYGFIKGYPCIFLKNSKCMIHKSKPTECRLVFGCGKPGKKDMRYKIFKYWKRKCNQEWIKKILGRKKECPKKMKVEYPKGLSSISAISTV